tara:strand:+ start:136 stop:444 length:309 start_codon:yes stop_codon:yes gene_type:complete
MSKGIKGQTQDRPSGGHRNMNVSVEGNRLKSAEHARGFFHPTDKLDKTFETESPYGGKVVKKGYTGKKELPLDKSKKKGSPRSYENVKKAKPLGKGKNKGVG